jgi:hypothetical protein
MQQIVSDSDLIRIKATYTAKYGMEIDEWTAINLCEQEAQFNGFKIELAKSMKEIEKASSLVKGQMKSIHFSNEQQAFKYGLSSRFYPFLTLAIGMLLAWVFYCIFGLQKQEKVDLMLFHNLIKNAKVVSDKGEMKLVLQYKNRKTNAYGTYFEYDRKKDRLLVPLRTVTRDSN